MALVLHRTMQRTLGRLDPVDVGKADLAVGLGIGTPAQQSEQLRRDREFAAVEWRPVHPQRLYEAAKTLETGCGRSPPQTG